MIQTSIGRPSRRRHSTSATPQSTNPLGAYFNQEAILLDVRTIHEFYRSKIAGARHISYDMLPNLIDEIKSWNVPVITYSTHGGRSRLAAEMLERAEINVINGGAKMDLEQLLFNQ